MPKKVTREQLTQMCEDLVRLKAMADWYEILKDAVKAGLLEHKLEEVELPGLGRVKISSSPRWTVPPEAIRELLPDLAPKLIETKETVPNDRLKTFVEAGLISPEFREALYAKAKTDTQTSLYVYPQK